MITAVIPELKTNNKRNKVTKQAGINIGPGQLKHSKSREH